MVHHINNETTSERVAPDTDLAGYPAWPITGYPAKNKLNSIIKKK